jgi:hypothetical protein
MVKTKIMLATTTWMARMACPVESLATLWETEKSKVG